jgi:primosomal protein N' (replication factor Y)
LLQVAVTLPLDDLYTYRNPRSGVSAELGSEVIVPFGARTVTGFVVGHAASAPVELRDIVEVVGDGPAVDPEVLELCRWISEYYVAPLGEVIRAALPRGERAEASRRLHLSEAGRQLLKDEAAGRMSMISLALDQADREFLARLRKAPLSASHLNRTAPEVAARVSLLVERGLCALMDRVRRPTRLRSRAAGTAASADALPSLNAHQQAAFDAMQSSLGLGFCCFLLHGITGSGKTEVYMRLIAEARKRTQGALVLVPEIALTPQLAARFRARFGDDVSVLHSALPPAERLAAWRRLRSGEVGIAVGARSAVFAPVRSLGVVVVDEEHDGSFKQEDGVRYNGRDVAIMRAQKAGALAVLGSATPSLEAARNVAIGRFRRLELPTRANPTAATRPLPPVEIIDLRRHRLGPDGLLAPPLALAVESTLAAGEQVILFLNRRGYSTLMVCRSCGEVLRCTSCSVSMTLHQGRQRLVCHYCGRSERIPSRCPSCKQPELEGLGTGTERVESVVRERFPSARVARLDRDTTDGCRGQLEKVIDLVHRREIDILIGTQMVTKGHDFGGVTLVGVLQPDQGMHLPDFRAAERTFQLLEQVAGRAGRGERAGRILVQTYCPEHPAIEFLRRHDYQGFVRDELSRRESALYPPFSRMIAIRLDGRDEKAVRIAACAAAELARMEAGTSVRVLGPAEAPLKRLRGRSRFQIWLASQSRAQLVASARAAARVSLPADVRLAIDVDPQSVL